MSLVIVQSVLTFTFKVTCTRQMNFKHIV